MDLKRQAYNLRKMIREFQRDELLKYSPSSKDSPEFQQLNNQRMLLWEKYEAARNKQFTI